MLIYKQCCQDVKLYIMKKSDFRLLKKKFGEENIAIERSDLHRALFAGLDSNYFHFNKKVNSFKQTNEKVTVNFTDNTSISADYVIAADGIHSIFRQTLIPKSKPIFEVYTCMSSLAIIKNDVELHISSEA